MLKKSLLRFSIGIFAGIVIFYWLFHDIDWGIIYTSITSAQSSYIIAGFILMAISQISRAIRWHIIINESFQSKFHVVYVSAQIGLLFNFLIPARIGEFIRAYLLAKKNNVYISQSIATIMVDKIFDLIMMLAALVMLSFFISSHGELSIPPFLSGTQSSITISNVVLEYGFFIIGSILTILLILLVLIYTRYSVINKYIVKVLFFLPLRWKEKIVNSIEQLSNGLHILKSTKSLFAVLLWSILIWVLSYLAIYFIISSIMDSVPLMAPFVILVLVAIFLSFPIVPGVVGQYHLAVIAGLLFFYPDMLREQLGSLALITHFITLATVVTLGLGALFQERTSFISAVFAGSKVK